MSKTDAVCARGSPPRKWEDSIKIIEIDCRVCKDEVHEQEQVEMILYPVREFQESGFRIQ